jgi:hypothetical protein
MTTFSFLNLNYSPYVQRIKKTVKENKAISEASEIAEKLLVNTDNEEIINKETREANAQSDKFEKIILYIYNFLITFVILI